MISEVLQCADMSEVRRLTVRRRFSPRDLGGVIGRRVWRVWKSLRVRRYPRAPEKRTVLAILGCQRSGTNLMTRILDRDPNVKVYGEFSCLSSEDRRHGIRLNPLDKIENVLKRVPFPLIVLKPLVESQNANLLLEGLSQSKALWLYRGYRDVAASNLRMFGVRNGVANLRTIARQTSHNWRSERVSSFARRIVEERFSEDMNPFDAAALFWLVRNDLYFDQRLEVCRDVLLVKYEDLVADPIGVMRRTYAFAGHNFPGERTVRSVNRRSVGKGTDVALSDDVSSLCEEVMEKLDAAYVAQSV